MQVLNVPQLEDVLNKVNEISSRLLLSEERIGRLLVRLLAALKLMSCRIPILRTIFANLWITLHNLWILCSANIVSSVPSNRLLQVTLIVCPQATKLSDLNQWRDPLAAIVLYTFDLSILFPHTSPEINFYFSLNKVKPESFLLI
jgi:hypothetical protein